MLGQEQHNYYAILASYKEVEGIPSAATLIGLSSIVEGDVAVVDLANYPIVSNAALVAAGKFRIVQHLGDRLQFTPVLTYSECTFQKKKHITAVEQVSYIGYTGVTGSFPKANSTSYYIFLEKNDNDEGNRSGTWPSITGQWKTDVAATEIKSACAAAGSLFINTLLEAEINPVNNGPRYVEIFVTCADADGATTSTVNVSFNGRKVVVASATGLAVGGAFRVTLASGEKDCYIISAINGTTITLDSPWRHPTATGLTFHELDDAATDACGLKLKGLPSKFSINSTRMWMKNRFEVKILSAGESTGTLITTNTGANEGLGNWQQVAIAEKESWMNFGHLYHTSPPFESLPSKVINGGYYSVISILEKTPHASLTNTSNFANTLDLYLQIDTTDKDLPNGSAGDFLADILLGASAFTAGDLDA